MLGVFEGKEEAPLSGVMGGETVRQTSYLDVGSKHTGAAAEESEGNRHRRLMGRVRVPEGVWI